jgi:flagellum-specific peptidoglycan hydrolase FlgJ
VLINPTKREYSMCRWFAVYPSLEAAVAAYVDLLIESMRYRTAWLSYQKDGDADKFLQAVCAAGYATGPAFKVELEIRHQQNILHAVETARAETERAQ